MLTKPIFKPLLALALCTMTGLATAATTAAPEYLQHAVDSDIRLAADKARDIYRHPAQTLAFFEVKPTSSVVEIWPGSGWYSQILAPMLQQNGQYYAAHFPSSATSGYFATGRKAYIEQVNSLPYYKKVHVTEFAANGISEIAPKGSADVVLTFRNLHNWYSSDGEQGLKNAFTSFHQALKPGGILGVVEHRLPEDRDQQAAMKSGYMKQSYVIALAEQAGFKLVAASEINANSKDSADHPKGVWTLPPRLAMGEQDQQKYLEIGESDRMTLKFKKL